MLDWSQHNFAHVTTVTLLWHVQHFVMIGRVDFKPEHCKFWSNFKFDRNIVSGTGTSTWSAGPGYIWHLTVAMTELSDALTTKNVMLLGYQQAQCWLCNKICFRICFSAWLLIILVYHFCLIIQNGWCQGAIWPSLSLCTVINPMLLTYWWDVM